MLNVIKKIIIFLSVISACKQVQDAPDQDSDVPVLARRSSQRERYAADSTYLQKNANFFFQVWDQSFTRRLDDLPLSAEVSQDKRPSSGGYYPESSGGTDVVMVGGKSPLAKYDEAFNQGRNQAAAWERANHTNGPAWAGHCNGFAAAAQRHAKEPSKAVVRRGVSFDPRDIKALMAEVHMSADYEFLGGNRCERNENVPLPDNRRDPTIMDECEDINPGTLHAAVANWIGRIRHPLIIDRYRGEEVWNYPLYKYQVTTLNRNISEAQARQYVSGNNSDYIFNPAAQKFAYVDMTLTYADASKAETLGRLSPIELKLQYILELNADGEILGGEWVGRSVQTHPDFLWVALPPLAANGTRYMGNPHIDTREVIRLWAESAGFNPDAPPPSLQRPARNDVWGRFAGFEVTLDGNRQGAAFAGKPIDVTLKRRDNLARAGIDLDVRLNGESIKSLTTEEGTGLQFTIDPGIGLNRLQFVWVKNGSQIDDQYVRFHVTP